MVFSNSILPQTSEEMFCFVTKNIPYLCGVWRFANAYWEEGAKGVDAESVQRGERNGLYGSGQHRVHDHGGRGIYGYEE